MADLIGTATVRVDMDTVAATRQIRRFATRGGTELRGLQTRLAAVTRELGRVGDRTIGVTVDDRTAPGVASVRAAVRDLERLGPVRLNVTVDGAQSLRRLRDNSTDTGRALGVLAPQAVLTGSALGDLEGPAQRASGELRTLRTRATAAARALGQLAEQAMQTSMALRVLITTTGIANRHLDSLRDHTRDVRSEMQALRTTVRVTSDGLRSIGDDSDDATRRLGDLADAGGGAAAAMGTSGGGVGAALKATAAVAGLALLPALGALVPMTAGVALAVGTLKVAFSGVGEAVALAGEDAEKYQEALKKMGPEQRAFTRALVDLRKEFGPIGREIRKVALPGFTQAVKDARPVVKILGDAMVDMGEAFGEAARGAGRMMKDSGFQGALQQNLKLGTMFVRDMTRAMGPFTRSLLDFGAASEPTLRAFSDGISGLLSKGLPGFFQGLETGVSGAAKFLDGLFDSVNMVLPAFGRLSGEIARVTGPIFGEALRALGMTGALAMDTLRGALVLVRPVFKDIAFAIKTTNDIGRIAAPTIKNLGLVLLEAFAPVGAKVNEAVGPMQRLNMWVNANKGTIQEAARIFSIAVLDMARVGVTAMPAIIRAFRLMSEGVLLSMDVLVSGAAKAFGWMPGIGDKLKATNEAFDQFKSRYLGSLEAAEQGARDFAKEVGPRLSNGKLKLNIQNWQDQIATAKAQMKSVPPSKRSELQARIDDLTAKVRAAKEQLAGVKGKSVTVRADTSPFRAAVGGIVGSIVGTAFINVRRRYDDQVARPFGATGGLFTGRDFVHRGYAAGGLVQGPGTERSDSVFAPWLSRNEFVVNARRTREHLPLLRAINEGRLSAGMSSVGSVTQGAVPTVAALNARGAGSRAAVPAAVAAPSVTNNFYLLNQGVIGSQIELDNWFTKMLDNAARTGRLPASFRRAVQASQR